MKLDKMQEAIVNSTADNIVVVAGAGSGKTRVLIERIRKLLLDGVDPKSIVAITFTKMAAEEMQQRIADIPNADECFIGTIHSFANFLLRALSQEPYELLTDEAESFIMMEICKLPFAPPYKVYLDYKSQHYNGGEVYEYITQKYGYATCKALKHILEYDANKEFPMTVSEYAFTHNFITFDELIDMCTDYLNDNHLVINYLFIDEFQDIGSLEYKFIKAINAVHNFVVGDDYQAIYGFKGASDIYFKNLLNSDKWQSYLLANNYRCGTNIIRFANNTIKNILSEDEELKEAIGRANIKGSIKQISQISVIPNIIKNNPNYNLKDWFILCRLNKEVEFIVNMLNNNDIPATTFKKFDMSLEEMKNLLNDNKVKVLTAHSAKGLENKNVIIAYPNALYNPRNYDKQGNLSKPEEIKLYYVAITRAIENLYYLR